MVAALKADAARGIARALALLAGVGACAIGGWPGARGKEAVPRRIWHVPEPGRGGPAADETSAYFLSKAHEVLAVDSASGHVRWRRKTLEEGEAQSGAALLVAGESLIVGDYNLLAFDRRTGGLRWRFVPAEGYGPGVYLGAISDGAALAGSPSGHLYAVDVDSGALRWSTRVATDGRTTVFSPAADRQFVAAGFTEFTAPNGGGVVVLAADTGRVVWKRHFPAPADTSLGTNWAGGPVFLGDEVVAASGDGNICGIDLASGELRWTIPRVTGRSPFPMAADRDFRPLALAAGVLISGSLTGQIIGYDLDTRAERWRFTATGLGSSAFRIASVNDVVYVPFANGTLLALRAADGQELWRIGDWTSGFLWPPAVREDTLFLTGAGDGMSAVRLDP
jgi:outer membrane protein assembly factor BamB